MNEIWADLSEKMCAKFFYRPQTRLAKTNCQVSHDRFVTIPKSASLCAVAVFLTIVATATYAEPGRDRNSESVLSARSEQNAAKIVQRAAGEVRLQQTQRSKPITQLTATPNHEGQEISSETDLATHEQATPESSHQETRGALEDQHQGVGDHAPPEQTTTGEVGRSKPSTLIPPLNASNKADDGIETNLARKPSTANEAGAASEASEKTGETETARSQIEPSSTVYSTDDSGKNTGDNAGGAMGDATTSGESGNEQRKLRIASWGGAYGQAQSRAIFQSIESQLGVKLERVTAAPTSHGNGAFDIVEVDQETLLNGCKTGAYSPIQPIDLPRGADGEGGAQDFIDGGLTKCGVGSFAWSSLILVDSTKFEKSKPKTISDVFNTKRFRGKRAFPKRAENLLEALAMADGTPRDQVYSTLRDEARLDGLFKRLELLLPHIVWVDDPIDAIAKLESGAAAFALAYSGRAFRTTIAGDVTALWDGHIYDYGSWAISAEAADKSMAKDFIALATSPQMLARQARLWPYGPMRKSAAAMVGRHALLDIELASFMPTSDLRLSSGLRRDAQFWSENTERLNLRLTQLLDGYPLGLRPPTPLRRPAPPTAITESAAN